MWRVISVDGHPVRGAYTFAVGPNPGPAPQFVIPTLSETAATPSLVTARWIVFLSLHGSDRAVRAAHRDRAPARLARAGHAACARSRSRSGSRSRVALVATPVYVLLATAQFALRSFWSFGALVPLMRVSAFGRGYLDLELVLALFGVAAGVALWLDRPERTQRSIAALLALSRRGARRRRARCSCPAPPATRRRRPRARSRSRSTGCISSPARSGSAASSGCSCSGAACRRSSASRGSSSPCRASRTSRSSRCSRCSASGIWASVLHLPTLASLWQTSYGKTIIVEGVLLLVAMLARRRSTCCARSRGCRRRGEPAVRAAAATLLRRLVAGEVVLVARRGLRPRRSSRACRRRRRRSPTLGQASAHTGPGPVATVVDAQRLPARAARDAEPRGRTERLLASGSRAAAHRSAAPTSSQRSRCSTWRCRRSRIACAETAPGRRTCRSAPALVMVGHWGLSFQVTAARRRSRSRSCSSTGRTDETASPLLRALAALLACRRAPSARADGDPASDYLLTQKVFFPFDVKVAEGEAAAARSRSSTRRTARASRSASR